MSHADSEFIFISRTSQDREVAETHFKADFRVAELLKASKLPPGEYLYIQPEDKTK